jgi:hypothetical protein
MPRRTPHLNGDQWQHKLDEFDTIVVTLDPGMEAVAEQTASSWGLQRLGACAA